MTTTITTKHLHHIRRTLASLQPKTPRTLALAFSGGSDSTALAHLLYLWRTEESPQTKLIAFTVDHQLRSNSTIEAKDAGHMATAHLGFDHHQILTCHWPQSRVPHSSGR